MARGKCTSLDDVLLGLLGRLSDGSLKVGIQGLDANRWKIDDILYVFEAYVSYAEAVHSNLGVHVPPVDVWGGGQVSQVPRFLGEDPYENLTRLSAIKGHPPLKCIYRGRQGFGFLPCSDEIQKIALAEAVRRGMSVFRTFDPMNDERNLENSIKAINTLRRSQLADGVDPLFAARGEALVFYVRPPSNEKPVSDLATMSRYAVKLCEMGFHEVAVADYANQLSDPEVTSQVFRSLRSALDISGFQYVPINLFAQGCSPAIVHAALDSGGHTADVAIGNLSGTLSNPNMHEVVQYSLERANSRYSSREHAAHPVLQALEAVRYRIEIASQKHLRHRIAEKDLNPEITTRSRLAFNAVGALHSAIQKNWDQLLETPTKQHSPKSGRHERQTAYLNAVLEKTRELWLIGGQFNMVSPMGFFCSFQAERLVRAEISGMPIEPVLYTEEFRSILKGRYGRNAGLERGAGDVALANAMHVLEFLDVLRKQEKDTIRQVLAITGLASFFSISANKDNKIPIHNIEFDPQTFQAIKNIKISKLLSLLDSEFSDGQLKDRLKFALTATRFPNPTETLADGRLIISKLLGIQSISNQRLGSDHFLSEVDRLSLFAILFKVNESDPLVIVKELLSHRSKSKTLTIDDRDVQNYANYLIPEIRILTQLYLKKRALRRYVWLSQNTRSHHTKTLDGLQRLQEKTEIITKRILQKIEIQAAASKPAIAMEPATLIQDAASILLSDMLSNQNLHLIETPPEFWKDTKINAN